MWDEGSEVFGGVSCCFALFCFCDDYYFLSGWIGVEGFCWWRFGLSIDLGKKGWEILLNDALSKWLHCEVIWVFDWSQSFSSRRVWSSAYFFPRTLQSCGILASRG